jgi:hypothetical protein
VRPYLINKIKAKGLGTSGRVLDTLGSIPSTTKQKSDISYSSNKTVNPAV